MIKIPFRKMHGAGNDFIMLDARHLAQQNILLDAERISLLCRQHLGIGADGLIIVSDDPRHDFAMVYYNADGREAEMCGNGARCAFVFARDLGHVGDRGVFRTGAGPMAGEYLEDGVRIGLTPPTGLQPNLEFEFAHPFAAIHLVDTGVPHLVIPVADLEDIDVPHWGPRLRNASELVPRGANINWVRKMASENTWQVRTYERGVEAETLACGTGAAASAVILVYLGETKSPVRLLTRGGYRLTISVDKLTNGDYALKLQGPAETVFSGEMVLDA